jgi:hypothetical protein
MKKLIAILLVFMILFVLGGCVPTPMEVIRDEVEEKIEDEYEDYYDDYDYESSYESDFSFIFIEKRNVHIVVSYGKKHSRLEILNNGSVFFDKSD